MKDENTKTLKAINYTNLVLFIVGIIVSIIKLSYITWILCGIGAIVCIIALVEIKKETIKEENEGK